MVRTVSAEAVALAAERYGAGRIGVFVGTSTSGILQTEQAFRVRDAGTGHLPAGFHYAETHNTGSLAAYLRARLGLSGLAFVVSCACAVVRQSVRPCRADDRRRTGAMRRYVGGAGLLEGAWKMTLYGFHSLELRMRRARAVRFDADVTVFQSVRPRVSSCWNGPEVMAWRDDPGNGLRDGPDDNAGDSVHLAWRR